MKFLLIFSILITFSISAKTPKWNQLQEGERYKLKQKLTLKAGDQRIQFKKGTKLKLVESSDLNMIKVHLQRYKVENCRKKEAQTDLEIISVKNNRSTFGANLSKGCILEVFVEKKDYQKESILL